MIIELPGPYSVDDVSSSVYSCRYRISFVYPQPMRGSEISGDSIAMKRNNSVKFDPMHQFVWKYISAKLNKTDSFF